MNGIQIVAKESLNGIIAFFIWILFCFFVDFSFGLFLGVVGILLWCWAFRNPERIAMQKDNIILAPIDGEVIGIKKTEKSCLITIKVRFFDAGFIRLPLESKTIKITQKSGLLLYFSDLWKKLNQQIKIKGAHFEMLILPKVFAPSSINGSNALHVAIGQRVGFMKVGELQLHITKPQVDICINVGDKIISGQSIIGYLK